jgi:acetyl-CoA C-acetyltransferase
MIRAGDADIVVAGGMESMTQAPYLLPGARAGYRIGDAALVDSMMYDGLTDAFDHIAMGLSTEQHNQKVGISRERQDAFAAASHEKAAAAAKDGRLAEEIVPVQRAPAQGRPAPGRCGRGRAARHHGRVAGRPEAGLRQGRDHHRRQRLADLRRRRGRHRDVGGQGQGARHRAAGPDRQLRHGGRTRHLAADPALAGHRQGGQEGRHRRGAIDLFEINEAFAAVGLASADDLGIDESKINVNGGAIALGHPVGMSGTRVALTALLELRRRGASTAAVALCGGGGQGDAAILGTKSTIGHCGRGLLIQKGKGVGGRPSFELWSPRRIAEELLGPERRGEGDVGLH